MSLLPYYDSDKEIVEIGVDEVGRGPLFGRVYSAAVILPKNNEFEYKRMKDSKKFTSKKKLNETAEYIRKNCVSYSIGFEEHNIIDKHNIRNATHMCMHHAIKKLLNNKLNNNNNLLLVDGIDFKTITYMDNENECIESLRHICIKEGDNKYCAIAAASILAKCARDTYIEELCNENHELIERYDLLNNKGYGTKKHLAGIREYGISEWHRKSFGICKNYNGSSLLPSGSPLIP